MKQKKWSDCFTLVFYFKRLTPSVPATKFERHRGFVYLVTKISFLWACQIWGSFVKKKDIFVNNHFIKIRIKYYFSDFLNIKVWIQRTWYTMAYWNCNPLMMVFKPRILPFICSRKVLQIKLNIMSACK